MASLNVPSVHGFTVNEAINVILAQPLGLQAKVVAISSDEVDEGIVIGTDKPVGSLVDAGGTIVVMVSSGASIVSSVPQVDPLKDLVCLRLGSDLDFV